MTGSWLIFPLALDDKQKAEVREGSYELLMVLADVVAGQDPTFANHALAVLESGAQLRPDHPCAFHLSCAALLTLRKDKAGADRELAAAAMVPPKTPSDYFLIGQDEYKKHPVDAIKYFEMALRGRPDHFWARCLQAICFIRAENFSAAKANLVSCLEAEPDSAWLYLLRGYACGQKRCRLETAPRLTPRSKRASNTTPKPSSITPRTIFKLPWNGSRKRPTSTSPTSSS